MALGPEVIDLIGLQVVDELDEIHGVGEVAVVEEKANAIDMRILVEVVDPRCVERTGAPDDAVDFVAFGEQKVRQIRSVLASDACNESFFHRDESAVFWISRRLAMPVLPELRRDSN